MADFLDKWLQQALAQSASVLRLAGWWLEDQGLRCYGRRVNRAADRARRRSPF
jgi:hypothetical protein